MKKEYLMKTKLFAYRRIMPYVPHPSIGTPATQREDKLREAGRGRDNG
jgi:hypothetical protein